MPPQMTHDETNETSRQASAAAGGGAVTAEALGFLANGGEMGARVRDFDWSATPLGPPGTWPQALRTVVRLLLCSRHPMFVWWGPELIQFYNDAYRQTMGPERHPSALGQRGRECWAEVWDIIGPQIEFVMAGRGATWHEDQLVPVTRHGRREDVWWTYGYSPINDDSQPNGVGGVLVVCNDVTADHVRREALRVSEERLRVALAAAELGTWTLDLASDTAMRSPSHDRIFGHAEPQPEWGRAIAERHVLDEDRPAFRAAFARALETGALCFEVRVRWPDGSVHWIAAQGQTHRDAEGRPARISGVVSDVTARREAEARQALLAHEVDHRARNVLMVVQSALRLTRAPDLPSYVRAMEGRVAALARSLSLLAGGHWSGADLKALLEGELAPFLGAGQHATVDGPPVTLPTGAVQPLAMAVHELATNAVKHGALSVPEGRVAVSWHLTGHVTGHVADGALRLRWAETGGPPVAAPAARRGFGSRVLEATVRDQLGGALTLDWAASGLVCDITMPLEGAAEAR